MVRTASRLPGFRFEARSPRPDAVLPRMDIAVLVGFAASGPLDRPVPIESTFDFAEIFGREAALAWDPAHGEVAYAYLAPAVRAFFENGGRRCWVIRVAGRAQTNTIPVPGLAVAQFDAQGRVAGFRPAFAQARSPGSWSDDLRAGAALLSRPVVVEQVLLAPMRLLLVFDSPEAVVPGDLLRLAFDAGRLILLCEVVALERDVALSPAGGPVVQVTGRHALWLEAASRRQPPVGPAEAHLFTHAIDRAVLASVEPDPESQAGLASPPGLPDGPLAMPPATVRLRLELGLAEAPQVGALLRVRTNGGELWVTVGEVAAAEAAGSPPSDPGLAVEVTGEAWWRLEAAPGDLGELPARCERLRLEVWARQGEAYAARLGDLGFAPEHPRCWDRLPTDEQLYPDSQAAPPTKTSELWEAAGHPRFPLAGHNQSGVLYVPIGMGAMPDSFLTADLLADAPLVRDGLDQFGPELFVDRQLAEVGPRALLAEADFIRYQSPNPRALTGLHAALSIEEATLIAAPDAMHLGWQPVDPVTPPPAEASDPPPRPTWWHFGDCAPSAALQRERQPHWEHFLNCDIRVVEPPRLELSAAPDRTGTFTLAWFSAEPADRCVLEEASGPDFAGAITLYAGADIRLTIFGRAPGRYYYRVRAEAGTNISDWSNGVVVAYALAGAWQVQPAGAFSDSTLVAVHRALLRLSAARGDLFAVLALPEHYREPAAIAHPARLAAASGDAAGTLDAVSLSYGGLYHPWLFSQRSGGGAPFRREPPDGTLCGSLALRALNRGAWIAPANEPLQGVVALTPALERGRWPALQEARVNTLWQEPRGTLALSALTLSPDPALELINVRRLLSLLRRLALRLGTRYVFEPNDTSFRRSAQRGFEALLDRMFVRGAFAGRTPATSYQVAVISTPQDVDQGRFIVELRVAPSLPMTFMTIRLIQTGEHGVVVEGR